jgi:periplasmic nitrate reductase NapD
LHISSIVVHIDPKALACVSGAVAGIPGLETHAATNDGKLVVTIEAPTDSESVALMDSVRALPGVLAVAMVFHQCETDPEQEI